MCGLVDEDVGGDRKRVVVSHKIDTCEVSRRELGRGCVVRALGAAMT